MVDRIGEGKPMRTSYVLMVMSFCVGGTFAQGPLYKAEVIVEDVTLRAGPSETMPETGRMFRGQKVIVDHELNDGWLAIEPPRGQVSWIKHLFLEFPTESENPQVPRNAIVHSEGEVDIATGRPGEGKPLKVRRTRIPSDTIVLIIGQKVEFEGSKWYPIEPPDGDLRYIPKSSVRYLKAQPSQPFVVQSPKVEANNPTGKSGPGGAAPVSVPRTPGSRPADWPNHNLWVQAQQAERNAEYQKAETLYLRLAAEMNQPGGDQELANLCYTQIHTVREKMRNPGRQPSNPAPRSEPPPVKEGATRWVGPGLVRIAGFRYDNRITFALLDTQNRVIVYAVNGPNVDLENFLRKEVDLYGTLNFPGELRGVGVLTVTRVQPTRQ
jgi:hypothetical protein